MEQEKLSTLKAKAKAKGLLYEVSQKKPITDYELSCGCMEYVQVSYDKEKPLRSTLWKEHSVYNVRIHDFESGIRQQWNSFNTLTEARKAFNRSKRAIINLRLWEKD